MFQLHSEEEINLKKSKLILTHIFLLSQTFLLQNRHGDIRMGFRDLSIHFHCVQKRSINIFQKNCFLRKESKGIKYS